MTRNEEIELKAKEIFNEWYSEHDIKINKFSDMKNECLERAEEEIKISEEYWLEKGFPREYSE